MKTAKAAISVSILLFLTLFNYTSSFAKGELPLFIDANYERVYTVLRAGNLIQKLYISITPSLYDYYKGRSHMISDVNSYNKFITHEAVEPIAKELRKIFLNDEQFANAVLSLVHKMKYVRSGPKYPVETLVENAGDCSALSFLAASIMIAGGLDVVLLHYSSANIEHLAVGCFLPREPIHFPCISPKTYEYKGKKYWVAESTLFWINLMVGYEPWGLRDANVKVIPISFWGESPSCVSARLNSPLESTTISIDVPPQNLVVDSGYTLKVSVEILPKVAENTKVVMYVSRDRGFSWESLIVNCANGSGKCTLTCNLTSPGTYYLRVSWNGSERYSGGDSPLIVLFVGPNDSDNSLKHRYAAINEFFNFTESKTPISGEFILLKGTFSIEAESGKLFNDFNLKEEKAPTFITFILNKFNHTLSVQLTGLGKNEILNMSQINNDGKALVFDISPNICDNIWYYFTFEANENETSFKLRKMNCFPLDVFSFHNRTAKTFIIIITRIENSIVVFKKFRTDTSLGFQKSVLDHLSLRLLFLSLIIGVIVIVLIDLFLGLYFILARTFES
ncbi:MAG: hypothetical protein QXR45_13010 [Candidatus Bathyarchaeia archaeon]